MSKLEVAAVAMATAGDVGTCDDGWAWKGSLGKRRRERTVTERKAQVVTSRQR